MKRWEGGSYEDNPFKVSLDSFWRMQQIVIAHKGKHVSPRSQMVQRGSERAQLSTPNAETKHDPVRIYVGIHEAKMSLLPFFSIDVTPWGTATVESITYP